MRDNMSYQKKYLDKLTNVVGETEIKDSTGKTKPIEDTIKEIVSKLKGLKNSGNKVIFIGNGGSAGIASHQAADYLRNGGIPTTSFHDPSLLTCISNDFGYEFVFEKPINMLARKGDVLIAISSSGKSKNILNAVKAARKRGLFIITMSGFSKTNPLKTLGDINFYVSSKVYGHVEISHLILSHIILDTYMKTEL